MKPSVDYHDDLLHHLKNPRYAVGYLNACLEDHDEGVFLLALRTWRKSMGAFVPSPGKRSSTGNIFFECFPRKGTRACIASGN